jgi:chromosome segregation protein
VAVVDSGAALAAIEHLKTADLGRAGLLLGGGSGSGAFAGTAWPALPGHATYAVDVVRCPETLRPALSRLLFKTAVVADLDVARALVAALPEVVAVTREGDVYGAHFASGGSQSQPSLLEVQAAYDEASSALAETVAASERLGFDISRLESERQDAQRWVDVTLAKLHESDATLAAVAEELGQHGSQARAARAEADRIAQAMTGAAAARERDQAGLAELEARLAAAHEAGERADAHPDTSAREGLVEAARVARNSEMEARLALRTGEERARALHGRADSLVRAADAERDARARAIERRRRLIREGRAARAVGVAVGVVLAKLDLSIDRAAEARSEVEASRGEREQDLLAARATLRDLTREHEDLVSSVHRDEMARTQQRMRLEQLAERALDELGLDEESLVRDYGPDNLVPFTAPLAEGEAVPEPTPYDREQQTKRLRSAERALAMLGKVNPLALEEFSALEERHKFLTEQLEDLKATRKDLLEIVREVDARVEQVFTQAYADVAAAFDQTFARLFPGGEGRLVLTDPGDMLTTGIEVEARPAGRKVKRLSLLSGGERSLVAVAFLVALFKARPSPFYILDEVEAALDDTNLSRLLEIYEELRESSQLLVITHQKRTMEVGDALYGVTMRDDGVSTVISQRLREPA